MAEETPSPPSPEPTPTPVSWGFVRPGFRNRILAGLVVIVPLGVTTVVAVWIYRWIARLSETGVKRFIPLDILKTRYPSLYPWLNPAIDIAAVVVTILLILGILWLIGSLSSSFLVKRTYALIERGILGLPIVRQVYTFTKQIVAMITRSQRSEGQRVVIIEYPKEGCYVLAFATGETTFTDMEGKFVTLFVPTTPNPTSGFMLVVPANRVRETNLTVEDAARVIISGGIIVPERIGAAPYGKAEVANLPPVQLPEPRPEEVTR